MKPSPTCEKTLLGQIIGGNFRIDGYLDSGAMASVYHATQISLERRVALKVVHLSQIDHDTSERFLREAHVISRLEHPHIVRLYEFGKDPANDVLYLAMEFIEGVNVRHVTSRGRLSQELVLEFGKQIARGLIEAHAKGIVHRDLKPANILIKPMSDGSLNLKVVDFGIARSLDVDGQLTAENIVCGTPRYLAPEQAISSRKVTPAMDIYSFGVLLYELLVGVPPFEAPGGLEVILKHINNPPKPPSIFLPPGAISDDLEELVLSMLAKSPDRRPSSSIEVLDALERIARRVREPIPRFKSDEPLTDALERLILDVPSIARAALERDMKGHAAPMSGDGAATISDKKYFSDDYLAPDQRTHIEEAIQKHSAPSSDTSLISRYDTHPDAELLEITEEEAPSARSKRNNPMAAPHASEDPTHHAFPSPITPSQSTESWPDGSQIPSHRELDTARAERPSILSAAAGHAHSTHDKKRFDLSMVDVLVALVMLVFVSTLIILWSLHDKDNKDDTSHSTPRVAATIDTPEATSPPPEEVVAEVEEDAREPEQQPEDAMEFEDPTPPETTPAASIPALEEKAASAPRAARPEREVARVKKSPKKTAKKKPKKSSEIDLLAPKKKRDDDVQESLRNSFKALKDN